MKKRDGNERKVQPYQHEKHKLVDCDYPFVAACTEFAAPTWLWGQSVVTRERDLVNVPSSNNTFASSWTICRRQTSLRVGNAAKKLHLHGPFCLDHNRLLNSAVVSPSHTLRGFHSIPFQLFRANFCLQCGKKENCVTSIMYFAHRSTAYPNFCSIPFQIQRGDPSQTLSNIYDADFSSANLICSIYLISWRFRSLLITFF